MMPSSSASGSHGTLRARSRNLGLPSSTGKPAAGDSDKDTASSSQSWQSDVNLNRSTGRPVATKKTQKDTGRRWPHNFWASDVGYLESTPLMNPCQDLWKGFQQH